jgi:hypothetical protein
MEQSELLLLDVSLRQNRTNKVMKNIANKVGHEEYQRPIDHGRKREAGAAENPAYSHASKTQLARMLGKVAGVTLILLPEFLGLHRVWGMSPVLVPGFPVGVLGVGCGAGCGGGSVLFMSFYLANIVNRSVGMVANGSGSGEGISDGPC